MRKIWHCREIETGEKLLADIKEVFEKNKYAPDAQALKMCLANAETCS